MSFDLDKVTRENIKRLKPYSSARDEFSGTAKVYLDANENPFENGLNRYPDPYQWDLKDKISKLKNVRRERIILGNGSDEIIDLLFRAFCEPKTDKALILPPTYGMYEVSAGVNNIDLIKVPLTPEEFDIDFDALFKKLSPNTKLIWLCSPNNPTGNSLNPESIQKLLKTFRGIVVVDEAYIDFSQEESWVNYLDYYPNLFVMQTFSKAWGLAGLRLGMGFGSKEIIDILNKIKPPYNINTLTQEKASKALDNFDSKNEQVDLILEGRKILQDKLAELKTVRKVYFSDANFLLVKIDNATEIYNQLTSQSIVVRNRSSVTLCDDCLRITVGTKEENITLLNALEELIN